MLHHHIIFPDPNVSELRPEGWLSEPRVLSAFIWVKGTGGGVSSGWANLACRHNIAVRGGRRDGDQQGGGTEADGAERQDERPLA